MDDTMLRRSSTVLSILREGPLHADDLAARAGLEATAFGAVAMKLEVWGFIARHAGNVYELTDGTAALLRIAAEAPGQL